MRGSGVRVTQAAPATELVQPGDIGAPILHEAAEIGRFWEMDARAVVVVLAIGAVIGILIGHGL